MNTAPDLRRPRHRKPPFILLFLAVALVVIGIVNVVLVRSLSATAHEHSLRHGIDLFISFFLAYALCCGVRWVRWLAVVQSTLGATVAFIGFTHVTLNAPRAWGAWILFMGAFYGFAAWLLVFSPSIVSYFSRPLVAVKREMPEHARQ